MQRWLPLVLMIRGDQHCLPLCVPPLLLAHTPAVLKFLLYMMTCRARAAATVCSYAGTGPDFILSVLPQALKANRLPAACAVQLCYHLAPYSAITLTDIKPPVLEADATAVAM